MAFAAAVSPPASASAAVASALLAALRAERDVFAGGPDSSSASAVLSRLVGEPAAAASRSRWRLR
eukprot:3766480-Prymnesium_polylepis.1